MEQLGNVAPCADCGGIVARSAVSCPHCGSTEFREPLIADPIFKLAVLRTLMKHDLTEPDLEKVTIVYLRDTQITDEGLKEAAKLQQLECLWLDNTQITDAGLKELTKLVKLHEVTLSGTKVTEAGVAELKKALPNCNIKGP